MAADELRPEYKRADFAPMIRDKYAARLKAASNVVVLRPEAAKAFPNAEAGNDARGAHQSCEYERAPSLSYNAGARKSCTFSVGHLNAITRV